MKFPTVGGNFGGAGPAGDVRAHAQAAFPLKRKTRRRYWSADGGAAGTIVDDDATGNLVVRDVRWASGVGREETGASFGFPTSTRFADATGYEATRIHLGFDYRTGKEHGLVL